jgi:hypothetical protein
MLCSVAVNVSTIVCQCYFHYILILYAVKCKYEACCEYFEIDMQNASA